MRHVDVALAVASKRDVRAYTGEPLTADEQRMLLDAGRVAGSARNRQPCRFVVAEGRAVAAVAAAVYSPGNVLGAGLVVALTVTPGGGLVDFDAGRTAQSMMLAAWSQGIASCPNGIADPAALHRALGIEEPERAVVVLGFGRPRDARDPGRRSPHDWSRRARRLPLDQLVRRVGSAP